jgi:hypothetical protein
MPVVERGRPKAPELSCGTPVGAALPRVPNGSALTAGAVVRG